MRQSSLVSSCSVLALLTDREDVDSVRFDLSTSSMSMPDIRKQAQIRPLAMDDVQPNERRLSRKGSTTIPRVRTTRPAHTPYRFPHHPRRQPPHEFPKQARSPNKWIKDHSHDPRAIRRGCFRCLIHYDPLNLSSHSRRQHEHAAASCRCPWRQRKYPYQSARYDGSVFGESP